MEAPIRKKPNIVGMSAKVPRYSFFHLDAMAQLLPPSSCIIPCCGDYYQTALVSTRYCMMAFLRSLSNFTHVFPRFLLSTSATSLRHRGGG